MKTVTKLLKSGTTMMDSRGAVCRHLMSRMVKSVYLIAFTLVLFGGFNTLSAQVIDFSNVNPDQGTGHGDPITATGVDGVQVTVEFVNIETSSVVEPVLIP